MVLTRIAVQLIVPSTLGLTADANPRSRTRAGCTECRAGRGCRGRTRRRCSCSAACCGASSAGKTVALSRWSLANDLSITRATHDMCCSCCLFALGAHYRSVPQSSPHEAFVSASLAPDGLHLICAGRGGRRIRHGWRREGRACWRLWAWAAALRRCCWCLRRCCRGDSI